MIRFLKNSKYSVKMEFDLIGAGELVKAFESAYKSSNAIIPISSDSSIQNGRLENELKVLKNDHCNKICRTEYTLVLELDTMSIEYGMDKLRECINGEDFYPAEFCEVIFEQNNVTIYGFLIR